MDVKEARALLSTGRYDSIAVVGPTASGKTMRAVEIAQVFGGEIISADSRQIYRNMDIGTGKDLDEYKNIKYHLIDIAQAGERYDLHRYLKQFHITYERLLEKSVTPVICGGSGMYLENALKGIRLPDVPNNDELRCRLKDKSLVELTTILSTYKTLHNTTDVDTVKRALRAIEIADYYTQHPEEATKANYKNAVPLRTLVIGIEIDRENRRKRISNRLKSRLQNGMIDEIKSLIDSGIKPDDLIYYGLEYKYVTLYVTGVLNFEEMYNGLETAIHQFAKRQMTWFRGMERRGTPIHWIPFDCGNDDLINQIKRLLLDSKII